MPSVRTRRAVGVATVVLASALLVTGVRLATRGDPPVDDATRVWCLSAAHRPGLVDAARALGLATPGPAEGQLSWSGRQGSPEQWQADRRADFDRTCRALTAAARLDRAGAGTPPPSPWATLLPSILLAAASATLAAWFSRRSATAGTRRTEADALRAATREYALAVESLLSHVERVTPGPFPGVDDLRARRRELASRLHTVTGARPRWRLAHRLGDALDSSAGPLHDVPRGGAADDPRRAEWVRGQRTELSRLEAQVAQVAQAVENPGLVPGRTPAAVR
ncbi:hypothetical protein [Micromonospora sp. NPDC051141]|uniref:hypothetical protein n=1 Tax=Micromonospora sp. NPDC051141 TaxID=3364284 RepID=UPI0037AAB588